MKRTIALLSLALSLGAGAALADQNSLDAAFAAALAEDPSAVADCLADVPVGLPEATNRLISVCLPLATTSCQGRGADCNEAAQNHPAACADKLSDLCPDGTCYLVYLNPVTCYYNGSQWIYSGSINYRCREWV